MDLSGDIITQFGLMNKISTGSSVVDILCMMMLPLILQKVLPFVKDLFQELYDAMLKRRRKKEFTRKIQHTLRTEYIYNSSAGPPNSVLQTAILEYINTLPGLPEKMEAAEMELFEGGHKQSATDDDGDDGDMSDTSYCGDHWESNLQQYKVNITPPNDTWIEVVEGIKFNRSVEDSTHEKSKTIVTTFEFVSELPKGNLKIDEFVQKAFSYYKDMKLKKRDLSRYLYMPVSPAGASDSGEQGAARYKRYKLSDNRKFQTLFHPDKECILALVDQFVKKEGKFAIPGYPQKLGFLLHGPPGTGKTTFIKVLAQHTGRSVVSIPLARIKTNQELMDIMFDQRCTVDGEELPISLPFSNTIFVMEDVDAASSVVNKRVATKTVTQVIEFNPNDESVKMTRSTILPAEDSPFQIPHGGSASAETLDPSPFVTTAPFFPNAAAQQGPADPAAANPVIVTAATATNGGADGRPVGPAAFLKDTSKEDRLNLAGLLNVLDGVVDTPERIVVMTTNHPEKLDPALIRPGRINKQIYMGRMKVEQALQMVRHYFGGVSDGQEEAVRGVFVDDLWSPAELESMCADFDTVEQFVAGLKGKAGGAGCRRTR